MTGIADSSAHNDDDRLSWLEWALFWYPFISVLLLGPVFLVLGWNWLALTVTALGAGVVLCFFEIIRFVTLPLLLWNAAESMLAIYVLV